MSKPTIALIIPLGDSPFPVDPGFGVGGGHPSQPIYHPGHPDHGLPSGGHPSQPIFHPGHPDHGLPASPGRPSTGPVWGGRPVDPGYGVGDTGTPSHPIHIPGVPDQGLPPVPGTPVQLPTPIPPPTGDLATDLVVAVWNPNTKTWKVTSWDLDASAGHPLPPTASPKS